MFSSALSDGIPLKPAGSKLVIAEWTAPGTPLGSSPEWIAPLHLHRVAYLTSITNEPVHDMKYYPVACARGRDFHIDVEIT